MLFTSNALVITALVSAVAIVIIIYKILVDKYPRKLPTPRLDISIIIIFSFIVGSAAIFTYSSVIVESVPINHFVEKFDGHNMSMLIDREPRILIPLKNAAPFDPRSTDIQASLYHNVNTTIQAVELSTTNSILEYPLNFALDNSTLTGNVQRDIYKMKATANHNLQANNATGLYTIGIIYSNKTGGMPQEWSVPFSWPIETMDMSIFSYFWIVLIGVMVSRLLSLVIGKVEKIQNERDPERKKKLENEPIILNNDDYIWITFSFIIAILIFTGFSTQVQLTTNILTNISLAFGFGFGFERVLEVAKKFQDIAA